MPNARLSERAPYFAEVDVVAAGLPAPRRLWGSDVSETGIFLQTTQPFRVGDRVSLRFDVDTHEVHVRAAEVMWVRPFEPVSVDGNMPGVGLKFVALDPPARAALRRFVQPQLADTQPESEPAALPPPVASLPPITGSILAETGRGRVTTDDMFAVSLPPFSQPPLNLSLPEDEPLAVPEEARVFRHTRPFGSPAPVTIGPTSTPPSFLVGWTFRRDPADETVIAEADDAPASHDDSAWRVADGVFDVTSEPPSADPELMHRELEEGSIALRHLPIAEERQPSPARKRPSRALPTALALLCAGTLVGSGIGFAGKRWQRMHTRGATVATAPPAPVSPERAAATAPRPVAEVERELVQAQAPATTAAPAKVAAAQKASAQQASAREETFAETVAPRDAVHEASVKVGDARIVKVFTLTGPSRLVVDLEGGTLPKGTLEPGGAVARIRFGHPKKGVSRVVVELDGERRARAPAASMHDGVLHVRFR